MFILIVLAHPLHILCFSDLGTNIIWDGPVLTMVP